MSIETNLASIAKSLETIAVHMGDSRRTEIQPVPITPNPALPAVPAAPAPAAAPPAFMMPPAAPAVPAVPVGPAAPFTDSKGLMEYVMSKYRSLGPVKGGMIQNVLSEIDCKNINDVQPAQYGVFFHKVEAIS